jgi:Esterase-like activity of phytase
LLLDLDALGITLDNVEGMAIGPDLADGRRTLVLVSDNNFSPAQFTQVLLFALLGEVENRTELSRVEASERTVASDICEGGSTWQ